MALHEKQMPAMTTVSGGFGRVAIWLAGGPDLAAPTTSTMQQRNLHFDPDLLIVPTGSKVLFPNLDPVFHNIFSLSRTQPFDLGYYAEGKSRQVVFSRAGIVQVYCHVHPEMYGVIVVTPSRWTSKPAPDGTFTFADVPPGKYQVVIWQHSAGLVSRNISVPSTGGVRVSFRIPDEGLDR
jgi:plastocyanin